MMLMNLSLFLHALLYIILTLYHAIHMVMGVHFIFVFSYVFCILNFSLLSMCKGGVDKGVPLICSYIKAKSMWLMHNLPLIHSDHFMICCTWLLCCIL